MLVRGYVIVEEGCVQDEVGSGLEEDDEPYKGNYHFSLEVHCLFYI